MKQASLFPLLAFLCASVAQASTVIYEHSFGGGASSLNEIALDTASNSAGGTSGATWTANPARFSANGNVSGSGAGSAYVPFTPIAGYQYTISLSLDVTSASSSNWIVLSLFNGAPDTSKAFNGFTTTYASIGRRNYSEGTGTDLLRWQGPAGGGTNLHIDEATTGTWTTSILLDTSNPGNWTFRWLMEAGSETEHLSDSYSLGTTSISHIMLSSNSSITADYSHFVVSAQQVPEVSSLLSASFLGLPLLLRRRKPSHS